MVFPTVDDTIIAVSSGWEARPVGIVRLSGRESFALAARLGLVPPDPAADRRPCWAESCLQIDAELRLPAIVYWFRRPRSYTGQNVVELHTVGCLPVLRALCARLIESGARRALPGEFTARAYLNGKLDAEQVEDVLALITSGRDSADRGRRRARQQTVEALTRRLRARLVGLLALIEAAIDFEEDISIISPSEVLAALDEMRKVLAEFRQEDRSALRAGKVHVALVGLPNAGKSMLFNRLVGSARALVSPVLGTTRDVLSVDVDLGGVGAVLQDCAGLGRSEDELELAAHLAAERAAERADLVLWVHPADRPWEPGELRVLEQLPPERRLLVWSKVDLVAPEFGGQVPAGFAAAVATSAVTGHGIDELRSGVCKQLSTPGQERGGLGLHVGALDAAMERARRLVRAGGRDLSSPELVALELRAAGDELAGTDNEIGVEEVLGRVFSQFCVGK